MIKDNIKHEIAKETNSILRELQMIRYLLVYEFAEDSLPQDVDYLKKIISYIKPNSDVWGYEPRMINNILQPMGESKYDYIKQIYEQHKDANVKSQMLLLLIQNAEKSKNDKILTSMYATLMKEYPGSMAAYEAEKTLNPNRNIKIGNQIPKFSFKGIDELEGKIISPETLKGKWVLIDNWATWCGPCIGELPELHKVYEKFKDKNFTVLSVSFDAMDKQVSKFRKGKYKMPWLHAFSEGVWESEASKVFEVMGIPKPILIDPNGKIVALEGLRGVELEKTLESMIK